MFLSFVAIPTPEELLTRASTITNKRQWQHTYSYFVCFCHKGFAFTIGQLIKILFLNEAVQGNSSGGFMPAMRALYGTARHRGVVPSNPLRLIARCQTDDRFPRMALQSPTRIGNDESLRNIAVSPSGMPVLEISAETGSYENPFLLRLPASYQE